MHRLRILRGGGRGVFSMSEKDGKSILNGAAEKKGFHTLKTGDETAKIPCANAAANCPVRIIKVSEGGKP